MKIIAHKIRSVYFQRFFSYRWNHAMHKQEKTRDRALFCNKARKNDLHVNKKKTIKSMFNYIAWTGNLGFTLSVELHLHWAWNYIYPLHLHWALNYIYIERGTTFTLSVELHLHWAWIYIYIERGTTLTMSVDLHWAWNYIYIERGTTFTHYFYIERRTTFTLSVELHLPTILHWAWNYIYIERETTLTMSVDLYWTWTNIECGTTLSGQVIFTVLFGLMTSDLTSRAVLPLAC